VTAWRRLDAELDLWRAAGREATLWCRDDDACRDSPALARLFDIAQRARMPVTLAVIPAALEPDLVTAITRSATATVVQHGYAHRNHAGPGERKRELRGQRSAPETLAELEQGLGTLRRGLGARLAAVLVPPWNRIDPDIVVHLAGAGFCGLSTLGPRAAACPVPGIVQCNAHVDLVDWRHHRAFVGTDAAIDRLVGHLRARRDGSVDATEATGVLTHHLDMDDAGWQFLADLAARSSALGAVWIDARRAFTAPGV